MMPELREWLPGDGVWSSGADTRGRCLPCIRVLSVLGREIELRYSFRSDETRTHAADMRNHTVAATARRCLARTIPPYVALARLAAIFGKRIDGMTPQMFLLRMEVSRDPA